MTAFLFLLSNESLPILCQQSQEFLPTWQIPLKETPNV